MDIPNQMKNEDQDLMDKHELKKLIKGSYADNDKAERIGHHLGLNLDKELSNNEQKVYIDKKGKPTIAFKGTNMFSPKDLYTDAALLFGLESHTQRFQDSKKLVDAVHKKYGKATIVGHSLGGSLASASGSKKDHIVTVNKGVGIGGIGQKIKRNETDIRTVTDPISLLSLTQKHKGKNITLPNSTILNPLKAHEWKNLKTLNGFV